MVYSGQLRVAYVIEQRDAVYVTGCGVWAGENQVLLWSKFVY
jgi:hypothetical protein